MRGNGKNGLILLFSFCTTIIFEIATPARAYESGFPGYEQNPGIAIGGATAGAPPPGIYMFDQMNTYRSILTGPGAPQVAGAPTKVKVDSASVGFLWVPGWTFLGATYDAVIVQPVLNANLSAPINQQKTGVHNTYIVPVELSWKLGSSGFFVKTGLGIDVPDGTIEGANGLASIGNPWWTFQPLLVVSYLKDGWNLTAYMTGELNTKNSITGYQSGNVMHAEFAATKQFEKWTLGPVAYYVGQVSGDKSSAFYNQVINVNKFDVWAVGGLVGYDFGPVALKVWGFREVSATASGGTPLPSGADRAAITQGSYKVFASISYRIWAPEAPAQPLPSSIYKKAY